MGAGPQCVERFFRRASAGPPELCENFSRLATRWPFNEVGMVNGHVEYVSPDAAELPDTRERDRKDTREHVMPPSGFRTLVALDSPYFERNGKQFRVSVGMLAPPNSISAAAR